MAIFEQFAAGSWMVRGRTLAFPVESVTELGGNRIIRRARPYRDGAKLDNTGAKERAWSIRVNFNNTLQIEAGLEINGGLQLYPNVLAELLRMFGDRETGTLVVPTVGPVHAKGEDYRRVEEPGELDSAAVDFIFVEDNQDDVSARSFSPPNIASVGPAVIEQAIFDTQSAGSWDQTMSDLERNVAELGDVFDLPYTTAAETERRADRVRDLSAYAVRTFSQPGKAGRDQFLSTRGNRAERKFIRLADMAGRARIESRSEAQRQVVSIVTSRDTSLYEVAVVIEQQELLDLVSLNPDLDPIDVPRNTVVRVRAAA